MWLGFWCVFLASCGGNSPENCPDPSACQTRPVLDRSELVGRAVVVRAFPDSYVANIGFGQAMGSTVQFKTGDPWHIAIAVALALLLLVGGIALVMLFSRMRSAPAAGGGSSRTVVFHDEKDRGEMLQPLDSPADNDRTRFGLPDEVPAGAQVVQSGRVKKKMPSARGVSKQLVLRSIEGSEAVMPLVFRAEDLLAKGVVLGRSGDASGIVLKHSKVSRAHAEVCFREEEGFFLRDLNAANGTYINKTRLAPLMWTPIIDGDTILIGGFHFRASLGG